MVEPSEPEAAVKPTPRWNGVPARSYVRPHERLAKYAGSLFGLDAADAMNALAAPNKMDRGLKRRAMDMLFPRDRPIPLAIPDIESAAAYNTALKTIHEAWNCGKVSPSEAESCMRLVNSRYRGWLKSKAGARVR